MNNLIADLSAHPWAVWALAALVSGLAEVLLPYFTFSFSSVAALIAAGVALRYNLTIQVFAFVIALFISLTLIRPRLVARVHRAAPLLTRGQVLIGQVGEVSTDIAPDADGGRILVQGQDWAARSTQAFAVGQAVRVVAYDGIVLIVTEV